MRITLHRPAFFGGHRLPAVLLAAGGVALVVLGIALFVDGGRKRELHATRFDAPTLALCAEGALMLHDVRWAASCSVLAERGLSDGHAECELPPLEAERLNRLLQQAEQKCQADAALGPPR
jgi:hypothetical protein